jgi:hypothetical protein
VSSDKPVRCEEVWRPTNREDANDAINGYTDYAFDFLRRAATNKLHTNVHSGLLTETYDLRPSAPIPAYQCFIGPS